MRFKCPNGFLQKPPKSKICVKNTKRSDQKNSTDVFQIYNKVVYRFFDRKKLVSEINSPVSITYTINCDTEEASFSIQQDSIALHALIGCKKLEISGIDILTNVIDISNILKIPIRLLDASFIQIENEKCEYSLSNFYILLTGQSWYNKYGFRSSEHAKDVAHNEKMRKLPLIDFVKLANEQYITNKISSLKHRCYVYENPSSEYSKKTANRIIEQFGSIRAYMKSELLNIINEDLPDIHDILAHFENINETTPVNEIIKSIYDDIKESRPTHCDKKFQSLKKIIDCSKSLLSYNSILTRIPSKKRKTRKS